MAENDDLTKLSDQQLINRWQITAGLVWTDEVQAIRDELTGRGYIYDPRYRDFIDCEGWNRRHGDWSPMDCGQTDQDER